MTSAVPHRRRVAFGAAEGRPASRPRRPGGPADGRRAAAAPGPAVRLPRARPRSTSRSGRLAGAGALRRPAGRRLRPRAARGSDHDGRLAYSSGRSARAGADAARRPRCSGRSPTGGPATSSTSCGSACRPGTRPPRAGRSRHPAPPAAPAAPDRRPDWPATGPAPAFLAAVGDGRAGPRGVVRAARRGLAGPARRAGPVALAAGRGAMLVVPDARDLARLDAALTAAVGPGAHVALSAELGPGRAVPALARRPPRRRSGSSSAPGRRLTRRSPTSACSAIWDDGDDLHAEPRAPYPHARDVLVLRSAQTGRRAAARRVRPHRRGAAARRVRLGARDRGRPARVLRAAAPRVRRGRPTTSSWPATRPRRRPGCPAWPGAPPARRWPAGTRCWSRCRGAGTCRRWPAPATARRPAARSAPGRWRRRRATRVPACRWCGRPAGDWRCPHCGERRLRAVVVGAGAHGRGARPGVPRRRRCGRPAATGCWPRSPDGAGAGRRHAGRRAGVPRRLRRRAAARRLGTAVARRPARRPRRRCGAGPTRPRWCAPERPGGGRRRRRRCPPSRRWCAGTRPASRPASWPSAPSSASRRRPGWPRSPGAAGRGRALRGRRAARPAPWWRPGAGPDATGTERLLVRVPAHRGRGARPRR